MTKHDQSACQLPALGTTSAREIAAYEAPRLEQLGDLRDVTLGFSRGAIESGGTRTFRR
jgi:hypothetical protein